MKIISYYCDVCKKEIIGFRSVNRITITEPTIAGDESDVWELCTKCKKEMIKYLKGK